MDIGIRAELTSSALLTVAPATAFIIAYSEYPNIKYINIILRLKGVKLEKSST
jgi:hypothetical protein